MEAHSLYCLYYQNQKFGQITPDLYKDDFAVSLDDNIVKVVLPNGENCQFQFNPQAKLGHNKVYIIKIDYDETDFAVDKKIVKEFDLTKLEKA